MLVSCSYCNKQHERGIACSNRPQRKKESTHITRFRSTRSWRSKSNEIKTRDRFLCQLCLKVNKYQFNKLEVHHIEPIASNWDRRLENTNLITLCNPCHKKADQGEITKTELYELSENNELSRL